jgi:CrcB protein
MLKSVVYVAAGGAVGAVSRYLVTLGSIRLLGAAFPWGTLVVNVLGSLFVGFLWGLFGRTAGSERTQTFFFFGLLGAFTTFSSYALDSLQYIQEERWGWALGNVILNNVGALCAAAVGFALARVLFHHPE